jgi:hypothetical protein
MAELTLVESHFQVRRFMGKPGFAEERSFIQPGARHGLFGAGCDKFVFRRALSQA